MGISGDRVSRSDFPPSCLPSREMRRISPGNIVSGMSSEHSGDEDDTIVAGDWLLPLEDRKVVVSDSG